MSISLSFYRKTILLFLGIVISLFFVFSNVFAETAIIVSPTSGQEVVGTFEANVDWVSEGPSATCAYVYNDFGPTIFSSEGWTEVNCESAGSDIPAPNTDGEHTLRVAAWLGAGFTSNATSDYVTFNYTAEDANLYDAEFWNFGEGESPSFDFLSEPDYTENNFDISAVDWGEGSPDPSINSNNFIGRFTKTHTFTGGSVRFTVTDADDGYRVYLDDELIMERWNNGFGSASSETVFVSAGEHTVVVEYYEDGGFAYLFFDFEELEPLAGTGTEEDPWQVTQCLTIFESGYYELQNNITDVVGDCIVIEADDVFFNGGEFTISSNGEQENQGVYSLGYDRINISNLTIEAFYDGIMLYDSEDSEISYVTVRDSGDDGIDLHGVVGMTISNSTITGSEDDGIEVREYDDEVDTFIASGNVTFTGLEISGNQDHGIEGRGVQSFNITDVVISDSEDRGIYIRGSYDPYLDVDVESTYIIIDNVNISQITDGDGIYIENTEFIIIRDSFITDIDSDGITMYYVTNVNISGNEISSVGSDGIYVADGNDITVSNNTIDDTGADGIDFADDYDENYNITITGNVLTNIGDNGIELDEVYGAVITGNSMEIAGDGMAVDNADDIEFSDNTITPSSVTSFEIPQIETSALLLDVENAEDSITNTDDSSFNYTLPFTFDFKGREIIAIQVSTNGAIELLEDGEDCQICSSYGVYSDYLDNDVIFSSFDDLATYDGYVAVFSVNNESGEYVVVEFYGSTLADNNEEGNKYMKIQTILYPNGEIKWNFLEMNFETYYNAMFTGVYDFEESQLYTAGLAIDEVSSYGGDFSGNGEFELTETFNQNVGLDLDSVTNSSFIGNSIRAEKWVYGADLENVSFNDTDSGNTYYLLNGDGAWTIFNITDSTGNGYADGGEDRPFGEEKLGSGYWEGEGEDWFPRTENTPAVVRPARRSSGGMASSAMLAKLGIKIANNTDDDTKKEETKEENPKENTCPADQILTQNLRSGSRNGRFNTYTGGIVTQANILQAHLNRLGFNSGPVDGILGRLSDGAIRRMQTFLGTRADGFVGPITRGLINNSCGSEGLQN
jgi:parallel beta-helix repeat protein